MRWLVLVVVAASGCAKSGARCHTEAEELTAELRALDKNVAPFLPAPVELATRDDLPRRSLPYAEAIDVQPGRPLDLDRLKRRYEFDASMKRFDGSVYIVIDKRVTWREVVAAFEAIVGVGYTKPMFAFVGSKPNPRPPPSKIDRELAALATLEDRGGEYARLMTDLVEDCDAFEKPIHHGDPEKTRTEQLLEDLPKDLVACNCRVDIPALRALLWDLLSERVPTFYVVVEPSRDGTLVRAPGDAAWENAGKRITATTTWLAVE